MSDKDTSKDDAFEALDFIINVLREHEKDLDRLIYELSKVINVLREHEKDLDHRINELSKIMDRVGEVGELNRKMESIEGRLTNLQNEIANLISHFSTSHAAANNPSDRVESQKTRASFEVRGPLVIVRCKQWEDFQNLARQAQTMSFLYKEAEKTFQVDALKNSQLITYSGEPPKLTTLLRAWLSKQLDVPETNILEGILAVG